MPIYAIFEEHEDDDYGFESIMIGYVESEEAAIRLCDITEQKKFITNRKPSIILGKIS